MQTRPKKDTSNAKTALMSRAQAQKALFELRSQIWKEMPEIDHAKGILRKKMLLHFLDERIKSDQEYKNKIPTYELRKTDDRQLPYLNQIFGIVEVME